MKSYKAYHDRLIALNQQIDSLQIEAHDLRQEGQEVAAWEKEEQIRENEGRIESLKPWVKAAHDLTNNHTMDENGHLLEYAWPGGYQIIYQDKYGNVLCPDCANKLGEDEDELLFDDPPIAGDLYQEGPPIECDGGCGKMIKSDYGDPSEKEEEQEA